MKNIDASLHRKQVKTMNRAPYFAYLLALVGWFAIAPVHGLDIPGVSSGALGTDGPLNPDTDLTIRLHEAYGEQDGEDGVWSDPVPESHRGKGIYDAEKWAVVFKYESVDIPSGVTVTFENNASRAPVVWLVSGDVNIGGVVNLNGQSSYPRSNLFSEPGPGGSPSGAGYRDSTLPVGAGFGIGGGGVDSQNIADADASYATMGNKRGGHVYGNDRIVPLIGGSGGSGDFDSTDWAGGAGAGAILIVARGSFELHGRVDAIGGQGYPGGQIFTGAGSGGAIRILAEEIVGDGQLRALGGWDNRNNDRAGQGRIRVEVRSESGTWTTSPPVTSVAPDDPIVIWPTAGVPTVQILSVAGLDVSVDPKARLERGAQDSRVATNAPASVLLETRNVDESTMRVRVRVSPVRGGASFVEATCTANCDEVVSEWRATVDLPQGIAQLQAHALPRAQ